MPCTKTDFERKSPKQLAGLSLDLDDKWTYMKTHGDQRWQNYPSYLEIFLPQIIGVLKNQELSATFFIVGQDATRSSTARLLSQLTQNGHDVGNHSMNHEVWMHTCGKESIKNDIDKTGQAIFSATGQKPAGFRGPGFVWNFELLEVLSELGYSYDASSLPSILNPIAKQYFFRQARLTPEEKVQRSSVFGSVRDGFRPVKPYTIPLPSGNRMLEIPVTTVPLLRFPFHMSYLLYAGQISIALMRLYLRLALLLCRITGNRPSFLLHPLDLLSGEEVPELSFFPGMKIDKARKTHIFNTALSELKRCFEVVSLNTFAQRLLNRG
jgi:peptidoglycan-N-acetylglucosamine deacetylase